MTARLARFARWAFLAGWIAGASYVTLADLRDWSWWQLALVTTAVVIALRWASDAIADRIANAAYAYHAGRRDAASAIRQRIASHDTPAERDVALGLRIAANLAEGTTQP